MMSKQLQVLQTSNVVAQPKKMDSLLKEGEILMFRSASLCPECVKLIPMVVFEKDGKALLRKECKEHGIVEDVYWGDSEMFRKAKTFEVKGKGIANPARADSPVCPQDCGLCSMHETHSGLTNIVITNRCDLTCWYCFFYAEKAGYIYEPTLDQLRFMAKNIHDEQPIRGNAVQITGGNPELREDIVDIIKIFKEEGIDHIQLNTNGTHKLAKPGIGEEWAKKVREAGVNTVYLSFDGTTKRTNPKNHWEIPQILDNCRKANLGVVLVPTVINTINDFEVGNILRFGFENSDIVKAVNYQPVSLVGRMPTEERQRFRITIPDVIHRIEDQTDGQVSRWDWYPVPCTVIFSRFIEALKGAPKYELSINPACGMGTYVFKGDDGKMVPLPRFVDIIGLYDFLKQKTDELKAGRNKLLVLGSLVMNLKRFIDKEKQPKGLNFVKLILNVMTKADYHAMGEFQKKSLFIGMMHFQDLYNWDIQRIKKCDIHYATPDKDRPIIPFCTFNVIPEWYRDAIQKKYSMSIVEWQAKHQKDLNNDLYKRDVKALEATELYKKTYEKFDVNQKPILPVVSQTH